MKMKHAFLAAAVAVAASTAPGLAHADRVICESIREHKNYCDMDTHGDVHIAHNLSKVDCVRGDNWGVERHGVWVAGGCRAEFVSNSHHDWRDEGPRGQYGWGDSRHHDWRDEHSRGWGAPAINCPPGTHVSSHRCSNEERRRGCKDYGAANGLGCSNW